MGCDIHLHIEVKVRGEWHHLSAPYVDRSYRLFGYMAGVRDDSVEPVSLPKGFPPDATTLTKIDYERWERDAHSVSWLGVEEIGILRDRIQKDPDVGGNFSWDLEHSILHTYLFGNSLDGWYKYPEEDYRKMGVEDVRLVFWFDN